MSVNCTSRTVQPTFYWLPDSPPKVRALAGCLVMKSSSVSSFSGLCKYKSSLASLIYLALSDVLVEAGRQGIFTVFTYQSDNWNQAEDFDFAFAMLAASTWHCGTSPQPTNLVKARAQQDRMWSFTTCGPSCCFVFRGARKGSRDLAYQATTRRCSHS